MEYEEPGDFYNLVNTIDELELAKKEKDSLVFHGHFFATSKTSVFYSRGVVPQADPSKFVVIHEQFTDSQKFAYATDGNKVFFANLDLKIKVLKCDAPESFEFLESNYSRDSHSVFYCGAKISYAKPATFEVLDRYYSKDANRVFCYSRHVKKADASSFTLLKEGTHIAVDKEHLFYQEQAVLETSGCQVKVIQTGPYGISGVEVGDEYFSSQQLYDLYQDAVHRKVVLAKRPSKEKLDETLLHSVAEEVGKFAMLCETGSFRELIKITRRIGEPAVIKAIQNLNETLPLPVAKVTKETVEVTPYGLQISRLGRPSSYILFGKGRDYLLQFVAVRTKFAFALIKLKKWASRFKRM